MASFRGRHEIQRGDHVANAVRCCHEDMHDGVLPRYAQLGAFLLKRGEMLKLRECQRHVLPDLGLVGNVIELELDEP